MKNLTKKAWLVIVIFALFGQIAWTVENMLFKKVYLYIAVVMCLAGSKKSAGLFMFKI